MNNTKKIEKKFNRDFSTLLKVHKVKKKDIVFLHVKLKNIKKNYKISYKRLSTIIIKSLQKRAVKNILVPSFFYSFSSKKKFDVNETKSENGFFSEFFRKNFAEYRSNDPFFSLCFLNKKNIKSKEKKINFNSSFQKNTIWDELFKNNVTIINIGLDHLIITLIHYIEYTYKVPYRNFFNRKGYKKFGNKFIPVTYNLYGRKNLNNIELDWSKIERFLISKKVIKNLDKSTFNFKCFKIKSAAKALKPMISKDPYFLVKKL